MSWVTKNKKQNYKLLSSQTLKITLSIQTTWAGSRKKNTEKGKQNALSPSTWAMPGRWLKPQLASGIQE